MALLRKVLLPALVAGLLAPALPAVAAEGTPVQLTAALRTADGGLRFVTEQVTSRARGLERVRALRSRPGVVAAEIASPVRALADDPLRAQQWGLTRLAAEQTWAQGVARGHLVAVIDTGVDASHPDLSAVTVPGLDLVGGGDGRTDPHGHGTHVAGVVAAVNGNGAGGAGLAQGSRILPIRALDADGSGYDNDVAEGVVWAVDHGAEVVNLSLGGENPSSLLTSAIDYALARGVVVVAAAGNAGASGDPILYPAATPGVIAVAAANSADQRPAWSSSGSHIAVTAPGAGILSTVPGGYSSWDGTSMAAPFVAAAAALLSADDASLTPAAIRTLLMSTARDLGAPGFDTYTGAGMIDVVAARAVGLPALETVTEPVTSAPVASAPVASEPVVSEPVVSAPVATKPSPAPSPSASASPSPSPSPSASAEPAPEPIASPEPALVLPAPEETVAPAPVQTVAPAPVESEPVAVPRAEPAPVPPPALSVFPAAISAGQRVTVTYRGAPGAVVDILSRTQPATSFSRIGSVTLDSTGTATSTHAPQKNTRITARSATGEVSSSQPIIAVRSVASLNVQRVGTRTYAFTGRVYPALNQRLVSLYRNGVLVAQGRSDATGVYRITKTLAGGTFTFQARTPNDQHNLGTLSPNRRALIA